MQWLILSLALTCGYMPQNVQMLNQTLYDKPCFEQTVEVSGLVAEHLNVFGSVQTYDTHNKGLSFFPFRADYLQMAFHAARRLITTTTELLKVFYVWKFATVEIALRKLKHGVGSR